MSTDLFCRPSRWANADDWRRDVVALHDVGPVHRVETDEFDPFWAVIDHATVFDLERRHQEFTNAPQPVITTRERMAAIAAQDAQTVTLLHLDRPEHRDYRRLTSDWFKPSSVSRLSDRFQELSDEALAKMQAADGRIDFATAVALPYPLQVILELLGLPESDYELMLKLTQEMFGSADPDHKSASDNPAATVLSFYEYFGKLTADRRANPTDDLASAIANGLINGEPMPMRETLSYYITMATAGHDTTSAAVAVGMQKLAEHPDQLRLLQERPELMPNAVDEMIRVATPTRSFMRTAAVDTEIAGQAVTAGDWIMLSFPGANHDPKVFADPLRFDIQRPNADKHLAFGVGVHHCLGAHLTRMELRTLFDTIVPQIESLELDGEVPTSQSLFVGGPKSLPIRYTLR